MFDSTQAEAFKSSIILDAIFKSDGCKIDESTVNVSVLFYFVDSICCHNDSYEIEIVEESEYEDSFPTETEADELENESVPDQEVEMWRRSLSLRSSP